MVARDKVNMFSETDETKTRLKNVRYINKNESVMCVCHVEDNVTPLEDQKSVSTETDSDSDNGNKIEIIKLTDTKKLKAKRKSVTFKFETDCSFTDSASIVSEPPPFTNAKFETIHRDDFALPPIRSTDSLPNRFLRVDKHVEQWVDKKALSEPPQAVPDRMFQTLNTLGLSPRIARKMSMETLSDIHKAMQESRQASDLKLKKRTVSRDIIRSKSINKKAGRGNLTSIPEKGTEKLNSNRLAPSHRYPKLPTLMSNFVASESEVEKLNFIKRALSPVPINPQESFRDRAATISGGEKRSWVIHRRNSQEHIGTTWMDSMPKELLEKANKEVDGDSDSRDSNSNEENTKLFYFSNSNNRYNDTKLGHRLDFSKI